MDMTKVWIIYGIFLLFYPIGISVALFLYWHKYGNTERTKG